MAGCGFKHGEFEELPLSFGVSEDDDDADDDVVDAGAGSWIGMAGENKNKELLG